MLSDFTTESMMNTMKPRRANATPASLAKEGARIRRIRMIPSSQYAARTRKFVTEDSNSSSEMPSSPILNDSPAMAPATSGMPSCPIVNDNLAMAPATSAMPSCPILDDSPAMTPATSACERESSLIPIGTAGNPVPIPTVVTTKKNPTDGVPKSGLPKNIRTGKTGTSSITNQPTTNNEMQKVTAGGSHESVTLLSLLTSSAGTYSTLIQPTNNNEMKKFTPGGTSKSGMSSNIGTGNAGTSYCTYQPTTNKEMQKVTAGGSSQSETLLSLLTSSTGTYSTMIQPTNNNEMQKFTAGGTSKSGMLSSIGTGNAGTSYGIYQPTTNNGMEKVTALDLSSSGMASNTRKRNAGVATITNQLTNSKETQYGITCAFPASGMPPNNGETNAGGVPSINQFINNNEMKKPTTDGLSTSGMLSNIGKTNAGTSSIMNQPTNDNKKQTATTRSQLLMTSSILCNGGSIINQPPKSSYIRQKVATYHGEPKRVKKRNTRKGYSMPRFTVHQPFDESQTTEFANDDLIDTTDFTPYIGTGNNWRRKVHQPVDSSEKHGVRHVSTLPNGVSTYKIKGLNWTRSTVTQPTTSTQTEEIPASNLPGMEMSSMGTDNSYPPSGFQQPTTYPMAQEDITFPSGTSSAFAHYYRYDGGY
ncbi:unnamed protein product [Orchesella dallaii]|uniref:Uncharacterized protein n=1 Tax=Orchesella dallaii TaxID=48710 RepID=A0ABP1R2W1_9HEXA